jgi:acyl carrier protein
MEDRVREQVRNFIIENFLFGDESRVPGDSESLLGAGIVDSTGVLELVDFLETDLGVTVADDETVPANLDSIGNLTGFVVRKRTDSMVA